MGRSATDLFEVGQPFDAVVYDSRSPRLEGIEQKGLTSALAYHTGATILGTIVNGQWIARDNHHPREDEIREKYLRAMKVIATF
jgi:formimidoylglutamate deiminase